MAIARFPSIVLDCPEPDGNEHLDDAVEGFVRALARGDVDTVIGIAADTTLSTQRSWSYSPLAAY